MAAPAPGVVMVDDGGAPFSKGSCFGERYSLRTVPLSRLEVMVREDAVVGVREDEVAVGQPIPDAFEPLSSPTFSLPDCNARDIEPLAREYGSAQQALPLHGSDRPLPLADQPFQNVEQAGVEVSPPRVLLEVNDVFAIPFGPAAGVQVPGDAQTLPSSDCPQQAVLGEIADVARVAILHRSEQREGSGERRFPAASNAQYRRRCPTTRRRPLRALDRVAGGTVRRRSSSEPKLG